MLVDLDGFWVDPEAVALVRPAVGWKEEGCTVELFGGTFFETGLPASEVAERLNNGRVQGHEEFLERCRDS